MPDLDFRDKAVTVVGLGIEGEDMARFLARRGAYVTVSDRKPREKLSARIEALADLPIRFSLGRNESGEIATADAVFLSQGVPSDLPGVEEARLRGAPIWSMLSLFMEFCAGPIVGITGSSGKTTTTALLAEMMRAESLPHFVGGNIGIGLLENLEQIRPYTWVVLEVSHTQLQHLRQPPHVAAVLNITPNHLDQFSWEEYRGLKANILSRQARSDYAVLNRDDPETLALAKKAPGAIRFFSLSPGKPQDEGAFLEGGYAVWRHNGSEERLFSQSNIRLRGRHNLANALAAAALARVCGVSPPAIEEAVSSFLGVPHRLQYVATASGVDYYNDSIATTPERTLAAIRSFPQPLVLLLGGRDKHPPLEELARAANEHCRAVITFGESGPLLSSAIAAQAARSPSAAKASLVSASDLDEAVAAARKQSKRGNVVLLSPACTSFDAYDNFEQRGRHFQELVMAFAREAELSLP